ncbi:MAG: DUF4388 domain-containing protein [Candidatus Zixiibacteriota bacterium]
MSFAGNLKTVSFGDVLQLISTGRKTGALLLQRPQRSKKVFFRNGDIIAASSDPPVDEERLGQLLLRRGHLTDLDLERALKRQRSTNRRLGQILVELGVVSRDVITTSLRAQVEEIVYSIFGWPDGEFRFIEGEAPESSQILVDLNALNAMMEGARRFDEYSEIAHALPSEDTVLRIVPSPHLTQSEIVLSAEDVDVLAAVDGTRSVGQIVGAGAYGEYAASKSLHKLLSSSLVAPCPEMADATRRKADEGEVYSVVLKLYSHALESIHKVLVDYLGQAGERVYFRLPESCPRDSWGITAALIDIQAAKDPEGFRERARKIPAPVRLHRVLDLAECLLAAALGALRDRLGPRIANGVVAVIQKDLAFYLAQKRSLVEEYDIQTEFLETLKGK